eukprot:CAMPEP_0174298372 /NCGR_PEP_ID=MMETSP0809-20121228/53539_1 /TAXON_ID=73025 ORGANISM="Eutreptiella gymnastica-like, Strain CCMP1594" /NCGR_SAMPLE_ID=MMETSP0809 /ASSEMBLY_ACC=CAM_ASM_000658 /LENGTH=53 /DNA_ID=CAMNT_0015402775 /DNA_START=190 /DNA_END=348 /DNA_ORIENTATION=-
MVLGQDTKAVLKRRNFASDTEESASDWRQLPVDRQLLSSYRQPPPADCQRRWA